MARYPEGSQGKHGHMGGSTSPLPRDPFPGARAGGSLHQGAGIQPGLALPTLSRGRAVPAQRKRCLLPIALRRTVWARIALSALCPQGLQEGLAVWAKDTERS